MDQLIQLHYRFEWLDQNSSVSDDAVPLQVRLQGFDCQLAGAQLTATPSSSSWSSADEARDALEPALRAWEAVNELGQGPRFAFTYSGASFQRQGDGGWVAVAQASFVSVVDQVKAEMVFGTYPAPDPMLTVEGDLAHRLRLRWREQRQGRERLGSACYGILTALENTWGDRRKAAAALQVSGNVLEKIGELTARQDARHGRAEGKQREARGLGADEVAWLEAATPRMILRVAEVEAGATGLQAIDLGDLPTLQAHQQKHPIA